MIIFLFFKIVYLFFFIIPEIKQLLQIWSNSIKLGPKIEHRVQSVDDELSGGLSYKLKADASYVTDRRSCTFFAPGGNSYSSTGAKVAKFNIVADQWMDPSSFRIMFTRNNNGNSGTVIQPLHWNPAVLFRRARVIAGGQVIEDIDGFNRLSLMFTTLKSQDDQKEIAMEGFGLFDQSAGGLTVDPDSEDSDERKIYRVSDWDEAGTMEKSRTVVFRPMLGLFDQEFITLRYCPIQIEFEIVSSASDCMFVGEQLGLASTDQCIISDIPCKTDLLTLDSSLQNEYVCKPFAFRQKFDYFFQFV